jgi:hypothetical protein
VLREQEGILEVVEHSTPPRRVPDKVAQADDVMFERNLSILSSKGKEILVTTTGQDLTGYAAGLDERWFQLCLTEDQTLSLIQIRHITTITETGRLLEDLGQSEEAKKIRDRIANFMGVTKNHSSRRGQ